MNYIVSGNLIIRYTDIHLFNKLNITQVCDGYVVWNGCDNTHIDDGYEFINIAL